ncbi:MAG TPA: hypothetical protein VFX27_03790 [Sphingobium sp.]|nr:hypothetical protein [Sphingobium sp.]
MPTEIWGFVIIGGPILLGLVLGWALWRNRQQRTRESVEETERATRRLREELDREDKAREQ